MNVRANMEFALRAAINRPAEFIGATCARHVRLLIIADEAQVQERQQRQDQTSQACWRQTPQRPAR